MVALVGVCRTGARKLPMVQEAIVHAIDGVLLESAQGEPSPTVTAVVT